MTGMNLTLMLPAGEGLRVEVPDDVTLRDLRLEIVAVLKLPTRDPYGRILNYRLNSRALGSELPWDQTLEASGVPAQDRLLITADLSACAGSSVSESPRVRRLRADEERIMEVAARSDLIGVKPMGAIR